MYIIAFTTNFRLLDNYSDALRLVSQRGGRVEVIAMPWLGDPSSDDVPAGCDFPVRFRRPFLDFGEEAVARPALLKIAEEITRADPDFVLLCNMQSYPSSALYSALKEAGFRGKVVGLQHGLHQLWNEYNSNFCADYVFCFGKRHVERLDPGLRSRAFAVGLPKLDRLRNLPTTNGGYVLFLPQGTPEPEILNPLLTAYEKVFGMPVVIHDHPRFPRKYRHTSRFPLPPVLSDSKGWTVIDYIKHANLAITLHSTAAIEALYLGKEVLILPNAGMEAFQNYPGIVDGFLPAAMRDAVIQSRRKRGDVTKFLNEVIGGIRFDHAERVYIALFALMHQSRWDETPGEGQESIKAVSGFPLPLVRTRAALARLVPRGGVAAELGVAQGYFSDELLRERPDFSLYSVDRWAGDRGHDDEQFNAAKALLARHGARSVVVKKTFDEALADFAPESLDLVYIDGYAHTGQDSGNTLRRWWSRVKPGGVFAGHDYHPKWGPTIDAVDAFCRERGLSFRLTIEDEFPSWYVQKPLHGGTGALESAA
jgi:Predicted O-methyltransferase